MKRKPDLIRFWFMVDGKRVSVPASSKEKANEVIKRVCPKATSIELIDDEK